MARKPYNEKPRSDSWDTPLTEAQRWQAYDKFVQFRAKWWEVAAWVEAEFGIKAPSRSGLYRFWERMKKDEAGWRTRQCIDAKARAGELARRARQNDAELAAAYETLAADAALQFGDAEKAMLFTKMAMAIGDKIATREKHDLKARQVAVAEKSVEERVKSDREKAVDGLMDLAKGNAEATALLKQFIAALEKAS